MKITKQDIKTLNKIKKMCNKIECGECIFNTGAVYYKISLIGGKQNC